MLRPILIALLATMAAAMDWEEYKITFQKDYTPWEESSRRAIYFENLANIHRHNAQAERGLHTFRVGVNKFTDLTHKEFRSRMNGLKRPTKVGGSTPVFTAPASTAGLPESVDWRKKGWVTPIKDQGDCGSCWAFSATGAMEGQHFNKTGKLVAFSEQELVDCSWQEGNDGCTGGWADQAFEYVIKNHGIDTENAYPYKGNYSLDCYFKKRDVGGRFTSYVDVKHNSEEALQLAVATVGPVSVAIDAGVSDFMSYTSGIYSSQECSPYVVDHGVLVVGYGKLKGKDFWLVKNSWGTSWGMNGYFLLARNDHNMCGIASAASFPLV